MMSIKYICIIKNINLYFHPHLYPEHETWLMSAQIMGETISDQMR